MPLGLVVSGRKFDCSLAVERWISDFDQRRAVEPFVLVLTETPSGPADGVANMEEAQDGE